MKSALGIVKEMIEEYSFRNNKESLTWILISHKISAASLFYKI